MLQSESLFKLKFLTMQKDILEKATEEYTKTKHPDFKAGDIVEVHTKIKEAGKERIQVFKGIVLAIKNFGVSKTFTVRKISYGIGVEKIFPLYAPVIVKIKVIKKGDVRRSKLYYLRKRVGKAAIKAGDMIPVEGEDQETKFEKKAVEKSVEDKDKKSEEKDETKENESKDEKK